MVCHICHQLSKGWTSCNHLFFFGCFTNRFSLSSFSEVKFVHGKIKIIGKAWWQIKTNEGFKMSSYTVLMHVFKYKKTGSEKSGSGCFRSQLITHNFWRHLINYKIAGDQFTQAVSCFCEETNDIPMEPAELVDSEKSPTWRVIANLKQFFFEWSISKRRYSWDKVINL